MLNKYSLLFLIAPYHLDRVCQTYTYFRYIGAKMNILRNTVRRFDHMVETIICRLVVKFDKINYNDKMRPKNEKKFRSLD